jgi:cobalt-zinc-cadmium efflux system outer membrane protein
MNIISVGPGSARWRPGRKLGLLLTVIMSAIATAPPSVAQHDSDSRTAGAVTPGSTVGELLTLVKRFNPDLAAAALDREEAVSKIFPAGALDDPTLNLARDQGFRQTTAAISQEFPLWGKRDLRTKVAEENANAARGQESDVAQQLEEQVKVAFAQYYEADQAIRVTQDIHGLLHTMTGAIRAGYAHGIGSQSDVLRTELEQNRLNIELASLERAEETAKAKINALIGRPADAPLAKPTALRKAPPIGTLALNDLVARATDRNPMLASAHAEIAAAEGERELVDKSYYPDVTVSVGVDSLPQMSPQLMIGVGIKIPLQWGVREAQERGAVAKRSAARSRLDGTMLKIESDMQSSLASLREAERSGTLLRNGLIPQSEAVYRAALASYQQGAGDLTAVLDAAHKQLELRIELLGIGTEQQSAIAAIERLIGDDL